jgi:hypothetical protein
MKLKLASGNPVKKDISHDINIEELKQQAIMFVREKA